MMAYKLSRVDVSVYIITVVFGLESRATRQLFNDIALVHKLINGKLSCPEFSRKINFKSSIYKLKKLSSFINITMYNKYN